MQDKFRQPDLFLVMNEEEMESALTYAEDLIGENEKNVEMYLNFSIDDDIGQYKLYINNVDVREYILDENNNYRFEFPMIPYYCLIFFENDGKRDCISLAIPISVWPEAYDIEYIKSFFIKHNFKIKDYIHKFFLNEEFLSTIKPESEQAKIKQIDSPWTIRDKDTLRESMIPGNESSAIANLEDVYKILLIKNFNMTLDFNATAVISTRYDTTKIDYSTFHFQNAIIIYTKDGKKTPIYIGNEVSYEEIISILKENNLSNFVSNKDLNDFSKDMAELIVEVMPFARFQKKPVNKLM